MIVSILNQKGGVGKTTLSVNLARAFTIKGASTLLIDSDPQGSARDWHTKNEGKFLQVMGLDRPTLDKDVENFRYSYKWVFIDSPSNLIGLPIVTSAIKCSDVVLIPIQPSQLDIWSTDSLVDLIKERIRWTEGKLKAAFVITRKISNTKVAKEMPKVLQEYGLPVFENCLSQRIAYVTCVPNGSTVLDEKEDETAINEINALSTELMEFIT